MNGRMRVQDCFAGVNKGWILVEALIGTDRKCLELEKCPMELCGS